jgi:hypothetical protein
MNGLCQSYAAQYRDGEHRFEYWKVEHGEEWERCADCGEPHFARFHDVGSGG